MGFLFVLKIRGKKMSAFFARLGTKKIAVGGSQRRDVPSSVLGVRRGRKPPRQYGNSSL